jgi:ParB/RepB/Spo0J family partition protein
MSEERKSKSRKPPTAQKPPLIPGISATTVAKAAVVRDELLLSGNSVIRLPIDDGRNAVFELQTIAYKDIEVKTTVSAENQRDQGLLNETSLSDILPTIIDHGQLTPAIAYKNEAGMIIVIEGSRRRMSCSLARKPFLVYVTNEKITVAQASKISQIGNKHRGLSLYEMGKAFEEMITTARYKNGKALANGEKVDAGRVSIARKAWGLPRELVMLLPSINAMGTPTINDLAKVVASLSSEQLNDILEKLSNVTVVELSKQCTSATEKTLNAAMLKLIRSNANQYLTLPKKTKPDSFKLNAGGVVKISQRQGKSYYAFEGLNEAQSKQLQDVIAQLK